MGGTRRGGLAAAPGIDAVRSGDGELLAGGFARLLVDGRAVGLDEVGGTICVVPPLPPPESKMRRQQMAMLQSLPYLDARVKELKLGLGVPTPDQILTLVEGQVARVAPRNALPPVVAPTIFPPEKTYLAFATKPLPPPSRKR